MKFTKMHGTGNDFVVINAMNEQLPENLSEFSKNIAERHFGVGCDQVLIIDKSNIADFKMLIFNNDGGQVEMCGNGIRCLARYAYEKGLTIKKKITVETLAGIITPEIIGDHVRVDMGVPIFKTDDWIYEDYKVINKELNVEGHKFNITLVSMGNPHCVIFTDKIIFTKTHEHDLVTDIGPKIERHENFPNRINVEFVKVLDRNKVRMRVWERGTGETLSCGTGAAATCVACVLNNLADNKITVQVIGGDLQLEWNDHVYLTGPAEFVFEGEW